MKTEWKLPKKTLRVWQLRLFLLAVILCAFLCLLFSLYLLSAIVLILCAVISLIFFPLLFKSYKITLNDTYISVEKGIFIITTRIFPRENLVYAESVSLPLSNALGVSAVVLKAARSFCVIPEIEKEKADQILKMTKDGKK